jgi:molybdate transport system substrate-binding protein
MRALAATFITLFCSIVFAAPAIGGDIKLSAAASLREALDELSASFAKKYPAVRCIRNYGGSGQMAKQIESGVPCDIFISANTEWMDYLRQKGVVQKAGIRTFTYNTLVFAGTPAKASSLQDLLRLERIAIASPKSVPAGAYAMEALKKAGLERPLAHKLVMAKDVRECLMYAERGEVNGAFVYRTDALQGKKVKILFTVPQTLYPRVAYPMALTTEGAHNQDAVAFLQFLSSKDAGRVLDKYGFARP